MNKFFIALLVTIFGFSFSNKAFSKSVIGRGKIRILPENEKMEALKKLMAQYHKDKEAYFNPAAIPRTLVYSLEVEEITAKRK